ncbi:MAG: bis-aminopropyl spermidine synthase family protein, partial [Promethearchaeota archaeon]
NVNIIKIVNHKRIRVQNNEILKVLFNSPSKKRVILQLLRMIPKKLPLIRFWEVMRNSNLLMLYRPKFALNVKTFQLPCSVKSSFHRAILILDNLCYSSQNMLFIGDDDLISILCKCIAPDLSISVIEIDGRITKLLKEIAKKKKFKNFYVHNLDFKEINESPEFLEKNYSIIHFDPPYEAKELHKFLNNIILLLDEKSSQIFLNGLFDNRSIKILNQFISDNKFTIENLYRSFNNYPLKPLDSKFLKHLKKQIKLETNLKFEKKDLKRFKITSDLYQIEKSWIE